MIMNEDLKAALAYADADADQFRGFGATAEDAMRNAVESGQLTWEREPGSTWADITADCRKAGIVTFVSTPYGVVIVDNN